MTRKYVKRKHIKESLSGVRIKNMNDFFLSWVDVLSLMVITVEHPSICMLRKRILI